MPSTDGVESIPSLPLGTQNALRVCQTGVRTGISLHGSPVSTAASTGGGAQNMVPEDSTQCRSFNLHSLHDLHSCPSPHGK